MVVAEYVGLHDKCVRRPGDDTLQQSPSQKTTSHVIVTRSSLSCEGKTCCCNTRLNWHTYQKRDKHCEAAVCLFGEDDLKYATSTLQMTSIRIMTGYESFIGKKKVLPIHIGTKTAGVGLVKGAFR